MTTDDLSANGFAAPKLSPCLAAQFPACGIPAPCTGSGSPPARCMGLWDSPATDRAAPRRRQRRGPSHPAPAHGDTSHPPEPAPAMGGQLPPCDRVLRPCLPPYRGTSTAGDERSEEHTSEL